MKKQIYTKKCERCAGTGQVYAYKGKPLFCSIMKGKFLHQHYKTENAPLLDEHEDQIARLRVVIALQESSPWGTKTCPDCEGKASWSYILEQLVYNDDGVAVDPDLVA